MGAAVVAEERFEVVPPAPVADDHRIHVHRAE